LDVPAKRHEFKDEWILALPFIRPEQTTEPESVEIWREVGKNFFECLDRFNWQGKRVLEIGAGRCWGVAELTRRGAYAVGLDILAHKYLGLETADIWFAAEDLYFERVLGDMHQLPFQPGAFDFVLTSSSLHHTDRLELALKEAIRVLDTKGHAFFINEPVVPDGQPKPDMSNSPEVQHGIIEARPTFSEWMVAFETAGFCLENVRFKNDMHILLQKHPDSLAANLTDINAAHSLRKSRSWLMTQLRLRMAYSRIKIWVKEKYRRAPSALKYYWHRLRQATKQH
jgi:SAM-dependent methyltransferase